MKGDATGKREPFIRSFVTRSRRLTLAQQRGWDVGFPKWGLTTTSGTLDWDAVFGFQGRRVVEIGFGMGDSLLQMARAEPDAQFVGVEIHRPGVGKLVNQVDSTGLVNLRVYSEDAVNVFERSLESESLDAIHIYFPDPWPKKRHHKRRLIQAPLVSLLADKLRVNGVIHLATDWDPYAEHMFAVLEAEPRLANLAGPGRFSPRPKFRPQTKFELRGERLGHSVRDIIYQRQIDSH